MVSAARQAIPVLRDAAALLRLLDAFADCELAENTMLQLHDRNGVAIEALRTWAASRNIEVNEQTNCVEGRYHESHEVILGNWRKIVVHDHTSRRSTEYRAPQPANDTIVVDPIEAGWTWSPHTEAK